MQQRRPTWFVYSGMGTQWLGMGRDLMKIEAFRSTVTRCSEALKPLGFNVYDVLMNANEKTFDGPLNTAVCLITIQVWLQLNERHKGGFTEGYKDFNL